MTKAQILKKAIELLGEKKADTKFDPECNHFMNHGYNYMHFKAIEVVEGLLERIEELEKQATNTFKVYED